MAVSHTLHHCRPLLLLFLSVLELLGVPRVKSRADVEGLYIRCRAIHFLTQDKRTQAVFSYHDDLSDLAHLKPKVKEQMVSAIVQLTDGESAMRMWSFHPHKYERAGDGVLFSGAAIHETLPWKDPAGREVMKVAFFLD